MVGRAEGWASYAACSVQGASGASHSDWDYPPGRFGHYHHTGVHHAGSGPAACADGRSLVHR
eukprot:6343345-Amphidinium_carterae.1